LKRFGELIYRFPITAILLLGLIAVSAVYPALQISTDFNLEGFYPTDDQVIEDYRLLEEEFSRDDNTILVGFETDAIFKYEVLKDLKNITEQIAGLPHIQSVNSIWNITEMRNINDRLVFEPYLQVDNSSDPELQEVKNRILDDPFVSGFLINPSASITAFVIEINDSENNYEARDRIITSVSSILSEYEYEFRISGIPYFRNQYVNYLNSEIIIYIIISSILIISILWMLYRSALGVLLPMAIVWTTLLMTIAIIQLSGGYLEIMSSTIAPILLCVGVADAVHMISKYDDTKHQGIPKKSRSSKC
jgi:uncharacterized protein